MDGSISGFKSLRTRVTSYDHLGRQSERAHWLYVSHLPTYPLQFPLCRMCCYMTNCQQLINKNNYRELVAIYHAD